MIPQRARTTISYATLIYAISIMASTFIDAFVVPKAGILHLVSPMVNSFCHIFIGYGLLLFYREEKRKQLLLSGSFLLSGGVISVLILILTLVSLFLPSFLPPGAIVALQVIYSLSIAVLIASFILLRNLFFEFIKEKRNIFKGEIFVPIGFSLFLIQTVLNIIFPPTFYITPTSDNPFITLVLVPPQLHIVSGRIKEGTIYTSLYFAQNFLYIGYLFALVLGIWRFRRALMYLDKIPKELFDVMNVKKSQPSMVIHQQNTLTPIDTYSTSGEIKPNVENSPQPSEMTKNKKMFCVDCGLELDPDAMFCDECGSKNPYIG